MATACVLVRAPSLRDALATCAHAVSGELLAAVRDVAAGGRYVHPALGAGIVAASLARETEASLDALSPREREVLRLLALGHTNAEIAKTLHLSVRTTESHRARITAKLAVQTPGSSKTRSRRLAW